VCLGRLIAVETETLYPIRDSLTGRRFVFNAVTASIAVTTACISATVDVGPPVMNFLVLCSNSLNFTVCRLKTHQFRISYMIVCPRSDDYCLFGHLFVTYFLVLT